MVPGEPTLRRDAARGGAFARVERRFHARPLDDLLSLAALVVCAYSLVTPFAVVRHPPLTDLPMHATITSAFRHWNDPAWHFQDQFELQPFAAPTLTFYALGALLAWVLPIAAAVKVATVACLALVPIGLAVYCKGQKKSPSMGVVGVFLAFGTFTHWGFVSFVAATGLTLIGVGLAFMVLEKPTTGRTVGLALVSAAIFFTHVAQVPPYLAALLIVTLAMRPPTRSLRSLAIAVAPTLALLLTWLGVRPRRLAEPMRLGLDAGRAAQIPDWLFHSFRGSEERPILGWMLAIVVGVALLSLVAGRSVARGRAPRSERARRAAVASLALPFLYLGLYFVLPSDVGVWSLVYPREILPAALFAVGALPGLPRNPWARAPALLALLTGVTMATRLVAGKYASFERSTRSFEQIVAGIPAAPKLAYLMLDRSGGEGTTVPIMHFAAWVQAERGGWLSFHFATWEASPIRFRTTPPMDVAPSTPDGFERHPELFDVATRGKYFDWFLVRALTSPGARFAVDPSIVLVDHRDRWWLYQRQ